MAWLPTTCNLECAYHHSEYDEYDEYSGPQESICIADCNFNEHGLVTNWEEARTLYTVNNV